LIERQPLRRPSAGQPFLGAGNRDAIPTRFPGYLEISGMIEECNEHSLAGVAGFL
jgi:hypothetical protein